KDFDISLRFYSDLGFQSRMLTENLAEMTFGACSFLLQNYYVQQWADNFVMHLFVSASPRAILSIGRRSLTRRRCLRCRCLIATASFLTRDQNCSIATAHQREACGKRHPMAVGARPHAG